MIHVTFDGIASAQLKLKRFFVQSRVEFHVVLFEATFVVTF